MVRDNAEIYRPVLTMDPGTASGQRRPRLKLYCTVLVLYCTVSGHQVRRNILVRAVAIWPLDTALIFQSVPTARGNFWL